jgi:hypothetical protein
VGNLVSDFLPGPRYPRIQETYRNLRDASAAAGPSEALPRTASLANTKRHPKILWCAGNSGERSGVARHSTA